VAAALAGLVAAVFSEALFGSRVFFQRDIHAYWYPGMAEFRRALAEGAWPLWSPHVGFGTPLLADASLQLAYPPTWLVLVLPLSAYFKLFAAGHCLWAGLGASALARRLGVGPLAAGVGGGVFALSGPLLSSVNLFHHYAGAAWMPWVLLALEALLRSPGLARAVGLGLTGASQLLAGSGDLALATAVLGTARVAWHVARSRPPWPRVRTLAAAGALAAALALALGALQWLPTAERARRGFRAGPQDRRTLTYWSLHPASLIDLAVPHLVADAPVPPPARGALFEGRDPLLACPYLGMGALVLAALALALGGRLPRLAAAGALFFLVASLGRHTPVYGWLLELPGFPLMRYPQKHLLPASLCVALLAAAAVQRWGQGSPPSARHRVRALALAVLPLALAGLVTAWWLWSHPLLLAGLLYESRDASAAAPTAALRILRSALLLGLLGLLLFRRAARERPDAWMTGLLLVLLFADLVAVGQGINPLAPPGLLSRPPAVVASLLPSAGESRIHAAQERLECVRPPGDPGGWEGWTSASGWLETLRPPAGARWGLFGSYDGEFTGLGSRWAAPVTEAVWSHWGTADGVKLLRIGNVGIVLYVGRDHPPGLEVVESRRTAYACPLQVLRVPDPLPRAYVVGRERPLAPESDGVAALLDPGFDPRREVLVVGARTDGSGATGPAWIVARTATSLDVEADLRAPGTLVVVEAFDRGWRASVDGVEAPVLRANALFRAVRLAGGHHRIRFEYQPLAARLGVSVSAAGTLAALALGLVLWRRRAVSESARIDVAGRGR
jgi:hypothetical protein